MTPTIELICGHRSIRHFTDEPISEAQREAIINSARATSSSSFLQCSSIIRITDKALREELVTLTGGQKHVAQAAESVIDAFRGLNAHILVQEYIKEAQGCDIRCLVVGDEVVAAIERRAKEGDFRSNLHRGGAASVASITPQEREIAIKAARTMALDVAGVDILRANRGPLVMEVNASPGLEGIEKTTGIDIASKMIRWIERHATTEYCLKTGG